MGMGYGSNFADTVDESFVKEVAGDALANFNAEKEAWLNSEDSEGNERSEWDLFELLEYEGQAVIQDPNNENFEICNAYDDLAGKFYEKTGLTLSIGYHNSSDNGDRYDEVDGFFWCVGGVYVLTPQGEKYQSKIKRSFYVTFG